MGPTWGPFGADRTQVGPTNLASWSSLGGTTVRAAIYIWFTSEREFGNSRCVNNWRPRTTTLVYITFILQLFEGTNSHTLITHDFNNITPKQTLYTNSYIFLEYQYQYFHCSLCNNIMGTNGIYISIKHLSIFYLAPTGNYRSSFLNSW